MDIFSLQVARAMGARTEGCSKISLFCHKMSRRLKDRFEIRGTLMSSDVLQENNSIIIIINYVLVTSKRYTTLSISIE